MPTERVREILSWYGADCPGTITNLARLFGAGRLAGTGRLLILPVDQGFEHGPARSFAPNPAAYDPRYHCRLAIESGCSAIAAPLGFLEACGREYAGDIPIILKLNGHDAFGDETDPTQAVYGSVDDALRLGCVAVGYTIYPGSARRFEMYARLREVAKEAKSRGLAVVVWSYPRGGALSKEGETAVDVIAYAAHLAAELGAHLIKVKIPSAHLEQAEAKKIYEEREIPIGTLADRILLDRPEKGEQPLRAADEGRDIRRQPIGLVPEAGQEVHQSRPVARAQALEQAGCLILEESNHLAHHVALARGAAGVERREHFSNDR
jgi:class I fructose-bisphosphate aldolase